MFGGLGRVSQEETPDEALIEKRVREKSDAGVRSRGEGIRQARG